MRFGRAALPLACAVLAIVVWAVPLQHIGLWTDVVITDVPVYQAIADGLARGDLPYRDLPLEYPPGAALVFWAAAAMPGGYAAGFEALMALFWALAAAGGVVAADALGFARRRQAAVGVAMAFAPLLLGNLVETRFDAVVAALLAWITAAAAAGRWRWMWGLLAVAVLVKLVPLALVPALAVWHAHRVSGRAALRGVAAAAGIVALVVVPIAVAAPSGLWHVVQYHLDRPPQLESAAASYMLLLHNLADVRITVENSFGSQGLVGSGPSVIATMTTVAVGVIVVALALVLRAGLRTLRTGPDARLMASTLACTVAVMVAGGKVLSPQFMLWLLPLGLLVAGRYGRMAFATTLAALVLTQAYFPRSYWDLVALHETEIWLLVARNATLLALVAMCWPRPAVHARPVSAPMLRQGPDTSTGADRAVSARYLLD